MGIERLEPTCGFHHKLACKKSPQTWGLKAFWGFIIGAIWVMNLQKESPDMGIESRTLLSPLSSPARPLQKESPDMGIERCLVFNAIKLVLDNLQKESPDMGIERCNPFHPPRPFRQNLQKESPDMGIESGRDLKRVVSLNHLAKRVPRHGD